jgi:hypothetical protein
MRTACFVAFLFAFAASADSVPAADPSLGSITPYGAQRGTEVEVLFNGARFEDAQEILIYSPGFKVTQFQVVNGSQVKTKLAIAPDCRLGIHAMRVRSATGVSNLRTFNVGPLKEIKEQEPNSEFAKPQPIEMNVTVNGVVENEDVDYFVVEAKKGQRISAEVEGIRLGVTFFDPYVAIMDMGRFELSAADDSALVWQDGVAGIVAPADGKYVIQVRESAYGGNGACVYRLHVGNFPRPTAVIPAGGKPGETLNVKFLGDVGGEFTQQVVIPANAPANFGIEAKDQFGVAPSPVPFRVVDLPNFLETEPNNDVASATAAQAPGAFNGVISDLKDVDFFKFPAKAGQTFDVRCFARGIRSPLDSVVVLYRSNGAGVVSNDDNGGPDSYFRFTAPADDEYRISVQDHLGKGGRDYVYRIEVSPVKPQLTMTIPEVRQYQAVTVAVPQNNRMAVMVNAARADFGGDLNVEVRGMPQGMTMETVPMTANQATVPVLFKVPAGAPLSGALADLVGKHADPKTGIEGHLSQLTWLVLGANNQLVWGHTADRMALVLSQETPFKIDIVQPKVPLVYSGSMELKVVATRAKDFNNPINVRMLYNPPGVGSVSSITIPQGQSEGTLTLNASPGAPLQTWKIAVIAQATVGNGSVEISSDFANLTIANSYFDFAFQNAAVEQGKDTDVVIKVTQRTAFEGAAKVELFGLPAEATTQPRELKKENPEIAFPIKTTAKTPPGRHRSLVCRAIVIQNGEPVTHTFGTGELRVDVPIPPKVNTPPPMPMPMPQAKPPEPQKPPERRLTRLEQLRMEREAARKAAEAGAKKEPPKKQ